MGNITITDAAIKQVRQIFETDVVPQDAVALRVFVSGGGCSGFQYGFSPASQDQIEQDDQLFEHDGAKFVVDPLSMMYLDGSTIDFKQDVMAQQFTISNPNATSQCGCGHSFGA